MAGVNFTLDSAKRIAAVVREVEAQAGTTDGPPNPARTPQSRFYAMLTGSDSTGTFWDWVAAQPAIPASGMIGPTIVDPIQVSQISPANSMWNFQVPYVAGSANAREANGVRDIPSGTVVELTFVGYAVPLAGSPLPLPYSGTTTVQGAAPNTAADGSIAFYVFNYNIPRNLQTLPIHDHRDNNPTSGGFAFATYHPGTNLPQVPYPT